MTTLYVSIISIAFASVLAMAAALLLEQRPRLRCLDLYTSFFRGTPLLLRSACSISACLSSGHSSR